MSIRRKKKSSVSDKKIGNCIQCKHSYDPHSMSLRGTPTLVKCPYNEYSVLANFVGCKEHFEWKDNITISDRENTL